MDHVEALLRLPFDTLAFIAAGYMSYRIAYTGKDSAHSTIDVIFMTLVFAFLAKVAAGGLQYYEKFATSPYLAAMLSVAIALLAAALWRRWGERAVFWVLRKTGFSSSDRQRTAWQSVLARPPAKGPTRLYVRCIDGTRLLCDRLGDFDKAPMGPCVLGEDGSVAMYVTDRKTSEASDWEPLQVAGEIDRKWGYALTYLPASQIAEIRINYPLEN